MSTCLIVALVVGGLGVLLLGVFGALALFGTRRYLAAAKSAEAKNTIGAISRAAVASYEREQEGGAHRLCKSAVPVPAKVPGATKYQPGSADFNTGDADTGWVCLKFAMAEPIYYQYRYQQGSGYVGTSPPSAGGFEASAQGDLDGNGTLSKFTRSGEVTSSGVQVQTQISITDELE